MAEAHLYTYAMFLLRVFCCEYFAAIFLREANLCEVILRDFISFFRLHYKTFCRADFMP